MNFQRGETRRIKKKEKECSSRNLSEASIAEIWDKSTGILMAEANGGTGSERPG